MPVDDEYIELNIDVFDVTDQRAKVRKTLTIRGLMDEILREFDDLDRKTPEVYSLFLKGSNKPLPRDQNLSQLDVQARDELVFKYTRQTNRRKISGAPEAFLKEERTDKVFDLLWQPAIIGRPDSDPVHSELLAVNLEPFRDSQRISRRHAQILVEDGAYYIESLAQNNPTYINKDRQPVSGKRRLKAGDKIRIGNDILILTFGTRAPQPAAEVPPVKTAAPQPEKPVGPTPVPLVKTQPGPAESYPAADPATIPEQSRFPADDGTVPIPGKAGGPDHTIAAPSIPDARLRIKSTPDPTLVGRVVAVNQTPFQIGREACDLVISGDRKISRLHASIMYDFTNRVFFLTDLGSSNGTWLNGTRLLANTPTRIPPGGTVNFGPETQVIFESAA